MNATKVMIIACLISFIISARMIPIIGDCIFAFSLAVFSKAIGNITAVAVFAGNCSLGYYRLWTLRDTIFTTNHPDIIAMLGGNTNYFVFIGFLFFMMYVVEYTLMLGMVKQFKIRERVGGIIC